MLPSIVAPIQLKHMVELAKSAPDGDFVEIGVFQGGSAWQLYQVAITQSRRIHLFDTFEGTPVSRDGLDKHKIDAEFASPGTPGHIRRLMPMARLYIGTYPDTHPKSLAPNSVAFIHCDCDQYDSYKAVIKFMWPLVCPKGILLFDDYPYLEGAKRAVEEHFDVSELKPCHQRFYVVKQ